MLFSVGHGDHDHRGGHFRLTHMVTSMLFVPGMASLPSATTMASLNIVIAVTGIAFSALLALSALAVSLPSELIATVNAVAHRVGDLSVDEAPVLRPSGNDLISIVASVIQLSKFFYFRTADSVFSVAVVFFTDV